MPKQFANGNRDEQVLKLMAVRSPTVNLLAAGGSSNSSHRKQSLSLFASSSDLLG